MSLFSRLISLVSRLMSGAIWQWPTDHLTTGVLQAFRVPEKSTSMAVSEVLASRCGLSQRTHVYITLRQVSCSCRDMSPAGAGKCHRSVCAREYFCVRRWRRRRASLVGCAATTVTPGATGDAGAREHFHARRLRGAWVRTQPAARSTADGMAKPAKPGWMALAMVTLVSDVGGGKRMTWCGEGEK